MIITLVGKNFPALQNDVCNRFASLLSAAKQLQDKLPSKQAADFSATDFLIESTDFCFTNGGDGSSGGIYSMFIEFGAVVAEATKQGEDVFVFSDEKQERFYCYTENGLDSMFKRLNDILIEMKDEFVAYVLDDTIKLIDIRKCK